MAQQTQVGPTTGHEVTTWREVRPVALTAGVLAAGVWVLATQVVGLDLVVGTAAQQQHVGLASVVVTAMMCTYVGAGLLRVLQRRRACAERVWTVVAATVLVVSLAGPFQAQSLAVGLALAMLHVAVAAVAVVGLRRTCVGRVP